MKDALVVSESGSTGRPLFGGAFCFGSLMRATPLKDRVLAAQNGLMDRWTCLRCFTANDDSVMECTNCGLLRGATPPAGTEQVPVPGARAGRARGILRRFLPLLIFGAIAFGGYLFAAQRGDNGEITQGGNSYASVVPDREGQ